MPRRRMLPILAGLLLAILSATVGCSPALTTIPTGHWEGHGTYVDYEAVVPKDGSRTVSTRSNSRSYETFLTITEMRASGRPAFLLSIRSMRGKLMNVPDEKTDGEVLLVETKKLPGGIVLYAILPKEAPQNAGNEDEESSERAANAALIPHAGGAVLQIGYDRLDPGTYYFLDTYTFSNNKVSKAGSARWASASSGAEKRIIEVFWSEHLSRTGNP